MTPDSINPPIVVPERAPLKINAESREDLDEEIVISRDGIDVRLRLAGHGRALPDVPGREWILRVLSGQTVALSFQVEHLPTATPEPEVALAL